MIYVVNSLTITHLHYHTQLLSRMLLIVTLLSVTK